MGAFMKIWITKYALTKGLITAEAEASARYSGTMCVSEGHQPQYYPAKDYRTSEAEALAQYEVLKARRLANLRRQIAKLERDIPLITTAKEAL